VQVNDLAHTLSSPSSSPILPPYSFELDDHGDLHWCLTFEISHCSHFQSTWLLPDFTYESCIIATFACCFEDTESSEGTNMYFIIRNCIETKCLPLLIIKDIFLRATHHARCLLECFNKHVASPNGQ
jgi:hypothetical protein